MDNKLSDAQKIVEEMDKDINLSKIEEMIKDNCITFPYKEKQYRVRLLNMKEKEELDMLRRKKFGALLKDSDILLEKDLILQLKNRGIDIDSINEDIKKADAEETNIMVQLGEALSKNESETILESYKQQVEDLRIKKQILNTQKTLLLEFSLENQLLNYVAQIITYLSLDELKDGVWQRMFNTLDGFQVYTDEGLITKAGQYSMLLQYL